MKNESQFLVQHMQVQFHVKLLRKQMLERKLKLCILAFWIRILTFRQQLVLNYSPQK